MNSKIYKLGIGPMSEEIIEAAYRHSSIKNIPLMLIASRNQIDWCGGYVNNWKTSDYMVFISLLSKKYPKANILICRDHCGPLFKSKNIKDIYKTIDTDIINNFQLIHIDFCYYDGDYQQKLKESKKAIEYINKNNSHILIEVGTDRNTGKNLKSIEKIKEELYYFRSICPIAFYVIQTGSLVKEVNQRGFFNKEYLKIVQENIVGMGIQIKEHNADYLNQEQIKERIGLVNSMNIAPCLGVLQTITTIQRCNVYGINYADFLEESYGSKKWEKWLDKNNENNDLSMLGVNEFNFLIKRNLQMELFNDIFLAEIDKKFNEKFVLQSLFACWCHMISLIPHHFNNKNNQALAFYFQAIEVGQIFLSRFYIFNKLNL